MDGVNLCTDPLRRTSGCVAASVSLSHNLCLSISPVGTALLLKSQEMEDSGGKVLGLYLLGKLLSLSGFHTHVSS